MNLHSIAGEDYLLQLLPVWIIRCRSAFAARFEIQVLALGFGVLTT